jgi:hypothetical protein
MWRIPHFRDGDAAELTVDGVLVDDRRRRRTRKR